MTPGYPLSALARLLIGLLAKCGVTHLVVSPGSRSTPYVMAAQRHGGLRLHHVVDERSAAYLALGLSRGSAQPVALLCTSGTAAANYLPAIVEARQTGAPLVVLTADRPIGLYDCGAPQTIDQRTLYGSHVVGSWSLTPASPQRSEWSQLKRLILSGVNRAVAGAEPGPVHFNLHSPKPLELVDPQDAEARELERLVTALTADVPLPPQPSRVCASDDGIDTLVCAIDREPCGLIAVGFDPEHPVLDPLSLTRFARVTGYPVLLDAAHPLRHCCPPELLPYVVMPFEPLLRLKEWHRAQAPRLVIQLGRPLTSSTWEHWLDELGSQQLMLVARRGWPDPSGHGRLIANADPTEFLTATAERLEGNSPRSSGWQARWLRAASVLSSVIVRNLLASTSRDSLDELSAVHALLCALPDASRLVVGNSLPIRHLDFLSGKHLTNQLAVYALRGASGIDGVTSTAIGISLTSDVPTTLLVGDISFLHDVGGLWAGQETQVPLAIVVLNNGGGRIFEQLPVSRSASTDELTAWTTPHKLDLSHAAALYGLAYVRVPSNHGLVAALSEALSHPRATVIDVTLSPNSARTETAQLLLRMSEALEQQGLLNPPTGDESR